MSRHKFKRKKEDEKAFDLVIMIISLGVLLAIVVFLIIMFL